MMDKNEIIERLGEIAKHAVHTIGEEPFIMSLDDGTAVYEAIDMLRSQPELPWIPCKERLPLEEGDYFVTADPRYVPPGYRSTDVITWRDGKWVMADYFVLDSEGWKKPDFKVVELDAVARTVQRARNGEVRMKKDEIPYPCNKCVHMKPWNLRMNGDHDYACLKKPPSKYGDPECDKLWVVKAEED